MKVIFMGTPDFAVKIVDEVSLKHDVVLVVTQPDKLVGRKKELTPSAVKRWALDKNIPIFQPDNIKIDFDVILNQECDIIITAAYGQIVPDIVLNHPKYKAINVHASLLPKYRGGAPIQKALLNGDKETGISIIYMTSKMDAGDIIMQKSLIIEESDYQDDLFDKLGILGASMINKCLEEIEKNLIKPVIQDEAKVTYAPNIKKEDEKIDFNKTAFKIKCQVRALNPNPGCYFEIDDKKIKVHKVNVIDSKVEGKVGQIISVGKDSFSIICGDKSLLEILELQLEGKKKMTTRDFLNGVGRNIVFENKKIY